ncbi:hypothetical protein SGPA1_21576 [Streptomyces misionensis JCM 4497]
MLPIRSRRQLFHVRSCDGRPFGREPAGADTRPRARVVAAGCARADPDRPAGRPVRLGCAAGAPVGRELVAGPQRRVRAAGSGWSGGGHDVEPRGLRPRAVLAGRRAERAAGPHRPAGPGPGRSAAARHRGAARRGGRASAEGDVRPARTTAHLSAGQYRPGAGDRADGLLHAVLRHGPARGLAARADVSAPAGGRLSLRGAGPHPRGGAAHVVQPPGAGGAGVPGRRDRRGARPRGDDARHPDRGRLVSAPRAVLVAGCRARPADRRRCHAEHRRTGGAALPAGDPRAVGARRAGAGRGPRPAAGPRPDARGAPHGRGRRGPVRGRGRTGASLVGDGAERRGRQDPPPARRGLTGAAQGRAPRARMTA